VKGIQNLKTMNLLSSKDQAYTSFGQLPLSVEKTAPAFGECFFSHIQQINSQLFDFVNSTFSLT
jgi:hypothetical protein